MYLDQIPNREWKDLAIAWLGTSLAFVPLIAGMVSGNYFYGFILSLLTVGIAFVVHECAHKFVAIREGFWAEFKRNDLMIALAIVLGWTVGFVFAAPGAATIYPQSKRYSALGSGMTPGELGRSAAAGPVSNIVLSVAFLALTPFGGFVGLVGSLGAAVNAFFALFNMIPFGPIDGKKIFNWDIRYFALISAAALGMFLLTYGMI